MLIGIKIKNFLSIKNETQISFLAEDAFHLQENVFQGVLKGALFFGGNASGKSSMLQSIAFLRHLLFDRELPNIEDHFCLFSDDPDMKIEYAFLIEGKKIVYALSFFKNKNISETFQMEDRVLIDTERGIHLLSDETVNPIPFFRDHQRFEDPTIHAWLKFLSHSIEIRNIGSAGMRYPLINEIDGKKYFCDYLKINGVQRLNAFLTKLQLSIRLCFCEGKIEIFRAGISHGIPFEKESLGIQTLLILLPAIFSLEEDPGMLIIDEFSSSFHNKLEEAVVRHMLIAFRTSQIFFASHSTNLMKSSLLRADQLFVTEFSEDGTGFRRISDFHPRDSQNIERMYLAGVFGGIPDIGVDDENL